MKNQDHPAAITLRALSKQPISSPVSLYISILALFYELEHPEEQHINALRLVLVEKITRVLKRYQEKARAEPNSPLWRFAKDQLLRYMPFQLQKTINTNDAVKIEALVEHLKISIFIVDGKKIHHYKYCGQEEEKETEAAAVEKPCQLFIEWKEGTFQPLLLTGGLEDNDYTLLPPGQVFNFFPDILKTPPELAGTSSMLMSDDSSSASDEERPDEKRPTF